jgi:hypothetical protein
MNRLLLLGCSERKRESSSALPAIELYDGPAFRTLRKFLSSNDPGPRTVVLSGKHGLVEGDRPIEWYDYRLERAGIIDLSLRVREPLKQLLRGGFSSVFVSLGSAYMAAIDDELRTAADGASMCVASGPPGVRAAMLATWLRGSREAPDFKSGLSSEFQIGGVAIQLSYDTAMTIARRELREPPAAARRFSSWSVMIDGEMVSPKWLLSIATGISVGRFSTHTACRVLTRLGLDVRPV